MKVHEENVPSWIGQSECHFLIVERCYCMLVGISRNHKELTFLRFASKGFLLPDTVGHLIGPNQKAIRFENVGSIFLVRMICRTDHKCPLNTGESISSNQSWKIVFLSQIQAHPRNSSNLHINLSLPRGPM